MTPSPTSSAESLDQQILSFEQAWDAGLPPSIAEFLARCDSQLRPILARELAAIDMEFRWQHTAAGNARTGTPTWRDYCHQLTELGGIEQCPAEYLAEEYRVRQLWGDQPSQDGFISSYPERFTEFTPWLARIDTELRADGMAPSLPPSTRPVIEHDPRAPLPWSDFLLQEHVGSGGFGKVYRAIQKSLDRPVAVKALHKNRQTDAQAVEQFIQEARLLARLKHPSIIGVHGLGRFPGGGYFLVLDWVEGSDLQQRLEESPLSIDEALRIALAVSEAIQHAHEHQVHGDLKPSNVLIDHQQQIYVTDFGLAQLVSPGTTNIRGGTLSYAAPEVLFDGPWGPQVDVYGIAALLFALLTGLPPRQGSGQDMLAQVTALQEPPPPSTIRPGIPPHLDDLVLRCLRPQPSHRYPTVAELAAALRHSIQSPLSVNT